MAEPKYIENPQLKGKYEILIPVGQSPVRRVARNDVDFAKINEFQAEALIKAGVKCLRKIEAKVTTSKDSPKPKDK